MTIDPGLVADLEWVSVVNTSSPEAHWTNKTSSEVIRILDGKNMQNHDSLFTAFAENFQFPSYFGFSWPALYDCLDDLGGLDDFESMDVVILNWSFVLRESLHDIPILLNILNSAARDWSETESADGRTGNVRFNVYLVA